MRKEFHISAAQLAPLCAQPDQGLVDSDEINAYWQKLGQELGFVWTTVSDMQLAAPIDGGDEGSQGASFTAEIEAPAPDPDFVKWFADHFPDWKPEDCEAPEGAVIISMTGTAFEAGRRTAADNLAAADRAVALDQDQIAALEAAFKEFCPVGSPDATLSIEDMKRAAADIDLAKAAALDLFKDWAGPIKAEIESREHDHHSAMSILAAIHCLAYFAARVATQLHEEMGTEVIDRDEI